MNIGEKIIRLVAHTPLIAIRDDRNQEILNGNLSIMWKRSAEEQLEALVEEAIRERLADVEAARKILEGKE